MKTQVTKPVTDDPSKRRFLTSLQSLQFDIDRLFEDAAIRYDGFGGWRDAHSLSVPADVLETADAFEIIVELAGLRQADIDVTFADGSLSIKGKKQPTPAREGVSFLRRERSHGLFVRSFALPGVVDDKNISASYAEGMLTVTVPKKAGAEAPVRKIPVE